jgi:hypothetical protein
MDCGLIKTSKGVGVACLSVLFLHSPGEREWSHENVSRDGRKLGLHSKRLPKAKAVPLHTTEGAWGERRYSSHSFSTSALDGGEWSESRPGRALAPGKEPPVPIVQEAGWAPESVWTQKLEKKSFASAGDSTSTTRSSSLKPEAMLTELPG